MIDITTEYLLTPAQAAKHPAIRNASGKAAHIATIHRLFTKGIKVASGGRVCLEWVRCPTGKRTSCEAIERFVEALSGVQTNPTQTPTTAARRRQEQTIDAELDRLGIM